MRGDRRSAVAEQGAKAGHAPQLRVDGSSDVGRSRGATPIASALVERGSDASAIESSRSRALGDGQAASTRPADDGDDPAHRLAYLRRRSDPPSRGGRPPSDGSLSERRRSDARHDAARWSAAWAARRRSAPRPSPARAARCRSAAPAPARGRRARASAGRDLVGQTRRRVGPSAARPRTLTQHLGQPRHRRVGQLGERPARALHDVEQLQAGEQAVAGGREVAEDHVAATARRRGESRPSSSASST